jgi:hypothetical protein
MPSILDFVELFTVALALAFIGWAALSRAVVLIRETFPWSTGGKSACRDVPFLGAG